MNRISLNNKGEFEIQNDDGTNFTIKRGTHKITAKSFSGDYKIDSYDVLKIVSLLYDKQIVNNFELLSEWNSSSIYNANAINKKAIDYFNNVKKELSERNIIYNDLRTKYNDLRAKVRANNKRFFKKKIDV